MQRPKETKRLVVFFFQRTNVCNGHVCGVARFCVVRKNDSGRFHYLFVCGNDACLFVEMMHAYCTHVSKSHVCAFETNQLHAVLQTKCCQAKQDIYSLVWKKVYFSEFNTFAGMSPDCGFCVCTVFQ